MPTCVLCRSPSASHLCAACASDVVHLGASPPPPDATRAQVVAWARDNKVSVYVCGKRVDDHQAQLDAVIDALQDDDRKTPPNVSVEWLDASLDAFVDMRDRDRPLTDKQVAWVQQVADALDVCLPAAAPAREPTYPGGRVPMPALDAMPKPLKPPGRK